MQDALAVPSACHGSPGLDDLGHLDPVPECRSDVRLKQAPFLITETNAGAIGGSVTNFPAFDGQWRQAAWAFVARGAGDDRVLALAHDPFRHRDVLDRDPPARPAAGPGLRGAEPAGRGVPHGG